MIRATLVLGLMLAGAAPAMAQMSIGAAVADPARPEADRNRDADRKPADMLAFSKVKAGQTVFEMMPGGGYFTRLFSDVVGPKGKVFAYVPDEMLTRGTRAIDPVTALSKEPGRGNVQVIHDPLMAEPPAELLNTLDVVWTSQNYHDFHGMPGVDMVGLNKIIYKAVKPGGYYIVLDHVANAGSDADGLKLHRIDPAMVRREVEAAGFKFDGESKVLANSADTHTLAVFDPSLRGHTDQFAYRFRKPK